MLTSTEKEALQKWRQPPESARFVSALGAEWEVIGLTIRPTRVRLVRVKELEGSTKAEVDRRVRFARQFRIDGDSGKWNVEHVGRNGREVVARMD